MSSLAKKFKRVTKQPARKPAPETKETETRAQIKIKRKKGKAKKQDTESKAPLTGAEEAIDDSNNRRAIKKDVLTILKDYTDSHPRASNTDTNKSRGEFPTIYNHLQMEEPFTSQELDEILADTRISESNMYNLLEAYNTLLYKYSYTPTRTKLLYQLSQLPDDSDPIFARQLLYDDRSFSPEDIRILTADFYAPPDLIQLIHEYNRLLSAGPHRQERTQNELVGRPPGTVPIGPSEQVHLSFKDLHASLKKARETSDKAALDAELQEQEASETGLPESDRKVTETTDSLISQLTRHVSNYIQSIKVQISENSKRDGNPREPRDISDEEANAFMLRRHILPYWTFMAEFITDAAEYQPTRYITRKMLSKYPEIATQFSHLFQRLSEEQQLEFVTTVFNAYPVDQFPNGPDKSIISLLVEFYNTSIDWQPEASTGGIDLQLTTISPDQLDVLFKSLHPATLLHYRDIIFGRFPELSASTRKSVLAYYSAYLVDTASALKYGDISGTGDAVYFQSSQETRPCNDLDFILPLDDTTKNEVSAYLRRNLPSLITTIKLSTVPSPKEIQLVMVPRPDKNINLLSYLRLLLSRYFMASLPVQHDFDVFLRITTSQIISDILSSKQQPSAPPDITDVADLDVELPENIVDTLSDQLTDIRNEDLKTLSATDLQSQAIRLGFNLNIGLTMARPNAVAKLQDRLDKGEITQEEYTNTVRQIDEVVEAYQKLSNKPSFADPDFKNKRRQISKIYNETVNRLKKDYRAQGIEPDLEAIQEDARKAVIRANIIPQDELAEIELGKYARPIRPVLNARNRVDLQRVVKSMPDALRNSLQDLLNNISNSLSRVKEDRKSEMANYYKFVTAIIIASLEYQKTGNDETLQRIEAEYGRLIPLPFIEQILDMVRQPGVTGNDLLRYVVNYTRKRVLLIRNPLIRQTSRRKQRYDQIFHDVTEAGTMASIRNNLPEPLAPHLKECVAAHQLKPWLSVPNIHKWIFLVANGSGLKRDQMPEDERIFFNISPLHQVVLVLPDGKKLYFYRPTTAYWVMHCQLHHISSDTIGCDVDNLVKTFTTGVTGANAKFYELMIFPPVASNKIVNNEVIVEYKGDNSNLIFLSNDKTNYEKECSWFKTRYTKIEEQVDSLAGKIMVGNDLLVLRDVGRQELEKALSLLEIKYGIEPLDSDRKSLDPERAMFRKYNIKSSTAVNAAALEEALFNHLQERGETFNIYTYLKELYSFLIFIDVTDPVGKTAGFFNALIAQSSKAYYPVIFEQFPDYTYRLPEVFLSTEDSQSGQLKREVRDYLDQKINLLIDQKLLRIVGKNVPASMEQSMSALLLKQTTDFTTAVPGYAGMSLKNICENSADYAGMDDKWLMYYSTGGKVYCISKLQLASMARSKTYKSRGIEFDPKFVDQFALFSEFTATELKQREKYIQDIVTALLELPENHSLFEKLAYNYNLTGEISSDDLEEIGIFDKLKFVTGKDNYMVMIITNKLNEVLELYISKKVLDYATQFIKDNKDRLLTVINERYKTYRETDPLSPSTLNRSLIDEDEYRMTIVSPAVDIVEKSINGTNTYTVSDKDRRSISYLVSQLVHVEPEQISGDIPESECAICKTVINEIKASDIEAMPDIFGEGANRRSVPGGKQIPPRYSTVVQTREGLDTRMKQLRFCSSKCFSTHKISESSRDDIELGRLQNAINKITQSYLDYTQMAYWARFPSELQLPSNAMELKSVVSNLSKIRGVSEDDVREMITTSSMSEDALGIFTSTDSGTKLSQTELWDRIRTHPMFVPSVTEMLKREKYESLAYLARKFNVPIYSQDWDEAEPYYTASPDELRDVWKELRGKPAVEKVLFSTIKSFDPYQAQQAAGKSAPGNGPILESIYIASTERATVFSRIEQDIVSAIQKMPDLAETVFNVDKFKQLREQIIKNIASKYPNIILQYDKRDKLKMLNFKKTLELWFDNHRKAVADRTPVVANFAANKSEHTISSQDLVYELGRLCDSAGELNVSTFSRWTIKVITNHTKYSSMKFATGFYPLVKETYKCNTLSELERRYTEFVFNLEKVNSLIDDTLAAVLHQRQRETAPTAEQRSFASRLPPERGLVKRGDIMKNIARRRRAMNQVFQLDEKQQEARDEEAMIQQMLSSVPVLTVTTARAVAKSREQLLTEIRDMRKKLRESLQDKYKAKLTGKITWKRGGSNEPEISEAHEVPEEEEKGLGELYEAETENLDEEAPVDIDTRHTNDSDEENDPNEADYSEVAGNGDEAFGEDEDIY